jgi:Ca-activated chloride channel family protein
MADDNELEILRNLPLPAPRAEARARALDAAMDAYDLKNVAAEPQGSEKPARLTERLHKLWSETMQKKLIAVPALAGLVALPLAAYTALYLVKDFSPVALPPEPEKKVTETSNRVDLPATVDKPVEQPKAKKDETRSQPLETDDGQLTDGRADQDTTAQDTGESRDIGLARQEEPAVSQPATIAPATTDALSGTVAQAEGSARSVAPMPRGKVAFLHGESGGSKLMESETYMPQPEPMPADEENRDRIEDFKTNPIKSVTEDPVSTFSIDVDTASYSFTRRSLKEGFLPQADTIRVEEMINYFPYDWKGPEDASTPFNTTVTVMPSPWNDHTKLMHVAIQGYDVKPAEQPRANLVFLLDVSGSMNEPDKLPLVKSAFRLLISKLNPEDTISIVTYAGDAGTVLMPTKVTERAKILSAIDNLSPGGTTAGEAGIREAYALAQQSFVQGGINRVMLATDGDFNVGQTDDEDLKRLIEEKRKTGVFLSVFGFGRGNLNDQMMQTIAQNGNGTAAYIDTLAEAEKVLVENASSTLFPIAKDVKIQVEFNPATVSEYRLIGYETRALNREDFNNDRVDAGEIGSGHSVTAIYEITPKGGPQMVDDLRYGQATVDNEAGIANAGEYAFVKIRYKLPSEDVSKLITTPVTDAQAIPSFDAASDDQRFSVAVAAFGQKLRDADATANMDWNRIMEIATAARGADPFGYRSEFLSLARLASALTSGNR